MKSRSYFLGRARKVFSSLEFATATLYKQKYDSWVQTDDSCIRTPDFPLVNQHLRLVTAGRRLAYQSYFCHFRADSIAHTFEYCSPAL